MLQIVLMFNLLQALVNVLVFSVHAQKEKEWKLDFVRLDYERITTNVNININESLQINSIKMFINA